MEENEESEAGSEASSGPKSHVPVELAGADPESSEETWEAQNSKSETSIHSVLHRVSEQALSGEASQSSASQTSELESNSDDLAAIIDETATPRFGGAAGAGGISCTRSADEASQSRDEDGKHSASSIGGTPGHSRSCTPRESWSRAQTWSSEAPASVAAKRADLVAAFPRHVSQRRKRRGR